MQMEKRLKEVGGLDEFERLPHVFEHGKSFIQLVCSVVRGYRHSNPAGGGGDCRWTNSRCIDAVLQELSRHDQRTICIADQDRNDGADGSSCVKADPLEACEEVVAVSPEPRSTIRLLLYDV